MNEPQESNNAETPGDRYENVTFSTGETLYVAPEILELMVDGLDVEKLFVESHSRGDCGIYGETLEEIAAHTARIEDEEVNPPIISAYPLPEYGKVVLFLTDRQNRITHIFGLTMERCGVASHLIKNIETKDD
jgi:hypothetical protein